MALSLIRRNVWAATRNINRNASMNTLNESCFQFDTFHSHPRGLYSIRYAYLPCCCYSQPASNAPQPTPAKPGLLKRVLIKSDEVFCKFLGRISPWMLQEYGHFKIGFAQFYGDAKGVYYINKRIRKEKLQLTDLHWKDLYVKKQVSNDLAKMAPTVIALCLPIVYYFVLPLMFLYPTVFLSNQFLSRDKLLRYYLKSYRQRAALYPTVLELLSAKAGRIQNKEDSDSIRTVLDRLQSEKSVTVQQALQARNAFLAYRFGYLSRQHLKYLCNLCSLRTMFMPGFLLRRKLTKNMALIQAMDHSILKEGVSTLDHLEVEKLCYERGLNVVHSDKRELEAWLSLWLELSAKTTDDDRSFIAHSVVLLAMGHPSCQRLLDIPSQTTPAGEELKKD